MAGRIRELSAEECWTLLRNRGFMGRLAFAHEGTVEILPINYLADGVSVTFCTESRMLLALAEKGGQVAFEVDDSRPLYHTGWSVVAKGGAAEVTDAGEVAALRSGPLKSWAAGPAARWVRVRVESITGRAIEED